MDHIIAPDVTLRQWVLTVPFELRLLLAAKPDALSGVGRIFIQEIQRWQRQRAQALGCARAEGAAVSFCQRFGSSLNLNIHWHVIVPDALFLPDATGEHVATLKHRPPTRLDLEEIVTAVATRSVGWLEGHGYLPTEGEEGSAENADTDSPWMRCLQGSLGVGELQRWVEHGRAEESANPTRGRALPKPTRGFGAQHRICYRIRDTEHARLMTPTQFLARLAALVPPPRHPLVRFYGVWAPHSRLRSKVVLATPRTTHSGSCAAPAGADGVFTIGGFGVRSTPALRPPVSRCLAAQKGAQKHR